MKAKIKGRPSSYTKELGEVICIRMVCGKDDQPESLRSICRDDGMPELRTVMRWLIKHEEFCQQYRAAREAQQEMHQEELKEIADDCTDDVQILMGNEDGAVARINQSAIARAKLRIDTRKWIMSKMQPKKYGEKLDLTITSEILDDAIRTMEEALGTGAGSAGDPGKS
jgi:hypothetical protein